MNANAMSDEIEIQFGIVYGKWFALHGVTAVVGRDSPLAAICALVEYLAK